MQIRSLFLSLSALAVASAATLLLPASAQDAEQPAKPEPKADAPKHRVLVELFTSQG